MSNQRPFIGCKIRPVCLKASAPAFLKRSRAIFITWVHYDGKCSSWGNVTKMCGQNWWCSSVGVEAAVGWKLSIITYINVSQTHSPLPEPQLSKPNAGWIDKKVGIDVVSDVVKTSWWYGRWYTPGYWERSYWFDSKERTNNANFCKVGVFSIMVLRSWNYYLFSYFR